VGNLFIALPFAATLMSMAHMPTYLESMSDPFSDFERINKQMGVPLTMLMCVTAIVIAFTGSFMGMVLFHASYKLRLDLMHLWLIFSQPYIILALIIFGVRSYYIIDYFGVEVAGELVVGLVVFVIVEGFCLLGVKVAMAEIEMDLAGVPYSTGTDCIDEDYYIFGGQL
ncbi:unnamed protein product, partial [Allacma fusca]